MLDQRAGALVLERDEVPHPVKEPRSEFFRAIFDRKGIKARVIEAAPGRGHVRARLKGERSKKTIVLLKHLDAPSAEGTVLPRKIAPRQTHRRRVRGADPKTRAGRLDEEDLAILAAWYSASADALR